MIKKLDQGKNFLVINKKLKFNYFLGFRYSGVNKLKSLATLIKSNPDYGSSASYHNKRPGYFYHFNSRPGNSE